MVDALVSVAAEGILKKVLSIATSEVAHAWGYKEKLTKLCNKLDIIRAKLRDAERQKGTEAVMVWLKQLKDVVSEADDVLDEVHYEMLRREVNERDRMTRKVPCLPCLKKLKFRKEIGHKIEHINKKLSEINKVAEELRLQDEQASLVPVSHGQGTDSYLDVFEVVGREKDEEHLIQLLTESRIEEKLTIVGMGGIGKTTLAKSVYNNPKIKQHFEVRAWVCVSVKVDVNTLLAKIYESLTEKRYQVQTTEILITKLHKKLGGKRYLLVLDDVWDDEWEHWNDFTSCMLKLNSKNRSGILVTTRNVEIGTNAMASNNLCKLQGLLLGQGFCPSVEL